MTYYPTLDEDLARAKEILAKGKLSDEDVAIFPDYLQDKVKQQSGTIHVVDIYAAYKLLESFVDAIERFQKDDNTTEHLLRRLFRESDQ